MKMAVVIGIFTIMLRRQKKNSGLQRDVNPSPRDPGAMLYQPSYAATDSGSRSILGSYVPVPKDMNVNNLYDFFHMHHSRH